MAEGQPRSYCNNCGVRADGKVICDACKLIDLQTRLESANAKVDRLIEALSKFNSYGRISRPESKEWKHNQEYKNEILEEAMEER